MSRHTHEQTHASTNTMEKCVNRESLKMALEFTIELYGVWY